MYLSTMQRRQNAGYNVRDRATLSLSTSPKRKAPTSAASPRSLSSPRMSGDYQVLRKSVDQQRNSMQDARTTLASSLDRIGEHHVRQKEYDEAMDAFTEALHEKRSIFSHVLANTSGGNRSRASSLSSSPFDSLMESPELDHDEIIDEIVSTLRSMGNVHSLRGEQDEAMRYFTEVTNLRATKAARQTESGDDTTLFSGLGGEEDNSTLMSEINEDVKALDDMFRSISFRNQENSGLYRGSRKAKLLSPSNLNTTPSSKRRKADGLKGSLNGALESEPFRRSISLSFPATGNELSEALEMYVSVLESYSGPNLGQHKENFNSLALRVDLLAENLKQSEGSSGNRKTTFAADLEMAVEIYQEVLTIQHEINAIEETDTNPQVCASIASTMIRIGSFYYKLGNRLEELRMYKEAKVIYRRAFGENHSFVAGAMKNIGMVLAERGEYDEAMNQFESAKKAYIEVNKGDSVSCDAASAISCMGNVKNRTGELDGALELYMEALNIYKTIQDKVVSGESNALSTRDITSTLKVIGMVHAKKGDLDTAMQFFTEAMTLLRSSGVDKTPTGRETTASVLTRMASIHAKKSDLDKAMEYYREAYDLTIQSRGTANHQEAAGILHYIGGIYHKRSEYEDAMNCYQEAIRIYHATLGPGNPAVAGTLVMVGSIHYKRRNLDSAMMFYREALRLNRDAYGLHHPDVGPILKSIGTILTKKGEYQEAYDIFRDVLSIKCTVHGTGHPEVASAYKSLGNVHYKLGELADAERQYRHALSIYRRTRGEEHRDTIAARTTIEHIRYWMKERGQRKIDQRHSRSTGRGRATEDERSC